MTTLEQYTAALRAFILQRPGFEPANYAGCTSAYRADYSRCLADRNDALELLAHVSRASNTDRMRDCVTEALGRYSRLQWDDAAQAFDYCTGQYFPVEYRNAAARVLSTALWVYWSDDVPADGANRIRAMARNALGKRLARRWFDWRGYLS